MTTLILCFHGNKEEIEREARENNPHTEFRIVDLATDPLPEIDKKDNLNSIITLGKIAALAIPDLSQYMSVYRDLNTRLPPDKKEEEKKEKKATPLSKYKIEELIELLVKGNEAFSCEVMLPGKQIVTVGEEQERDINLKELILLTMIQSILKDSIRVIRITPREKRDAKETSH